MPKKTKRGKKGFMAMSPKSIAFFVMIGLIVAIPLISMSDFTFSAIDTGEDDDDTGYAYFGARMWFEWEDERHDIEIGDQMLYIDCVDTVRGGLEEQFQLERSGIIYYGIHGQRWLAGELIRLEINYEGDPDWSFRDVNGQGIRPEITSGEYTVLYFYKMAEQWDFGELHIEWF